MTTLYIHGQKDVGQQRTRNEDDYRITPRGAEGWLLVVCDGMGGHGGGHIASAVACDTITDHLPAAPLSEPPAEIYEALRTANIAVMQHAESSSDPAMGTTAVIAWIEDELCWTGWVGDSRLYRFRSGHIIDQTIDHTRVQAMVELGVLPPERAKNHPDAHILTQAIGGGDRSDVRPSVWNEPMELEPGDVLLMCSDGLYDLIDDEEIYPLIAGLHYQKAVETLVAEANRRGGVDNITVVICVVGQPSLPALDAPKTRGSLRPLLGALLTLGLASLVAALLAGAGGAGLLLSQHLEESEPRTDTAALVPDAPIQTDAPLDRDVSPATVPQAAEAEDPAG